MAKLSVGLGLDSLVRSMVRELDDLQKNIESSIGEAATQIAKVVTDSVVDPDNWNDNARYSVGPRKGEKYDGVFTGRLIKTIKENVTVSTHRGSLYIGVGPIDLLDQLKTASVNKSDFPYWRSFVYGRKPIKGYSFIWDGASFYSQGNQKPLGFIIKNPGGVISGQEGTHMFDNGLFKARGEIHHIVAQSLRGAVRRTKLKWK